MNVLYIDMYEYDLDEARDIANLARATFGDNIVCLPTKAYLRQNVSIDDLKSIRDKIDKIIMEKEAENGTN